uniref:Uncharacterized protein n=1 Tax=Oryza sativa subsp. japonica TaxID=39947 RepID=Q6YUC3_ORYSJ|nr:hypothetical protein [Oryza sativa Japonica Group]BAD10677.1 hypothetical protein [Oryza sativa Japonica Group]
MSSLLLSLLSVPLSQSPLLCSLQEKTGAVAREVGRATAARAAAREAGEAAAKSPRESRSSGEAVATAAGPATRRWVKTRQSCCASPCTKTTGSSSCSGAMATSSCRVRRPEAAEAGEDGDGGDGGG